MFDLELQYSAHRAGLIRNARTIAQRQEWETISTLDRLERAIRIARTRLALRPATTSV